MSSKPPEYVRVSPVVPQQGETSSHHSKKKTKTKQKVYKSSSPKPVDSHSNPDPDGFSLSDSSSDSSRTRCPKRSKKSKKDDDSSCRDSNGCYYEDLPGHYGDYKHYQNMRQHAVCH